MRRKSILSVAREEQSRKPDPVETAAEVSTGVGKAMRPSRISKLHIGGYFDPDDPNLIAFQKLRIDLRKSQQEMLLEAINDFVAKHAAALAFR